MTRPAIVIALLLATAAETGAQDKAAMQPLIPVRLQLVFEKYQADKKTSSEPYTLSVIANDKDMGGFARPGKIRMGVDVPMRMDRVGDKDVPGNIIYRTVGNAADCTVASVDEMRFKVDCSFDQSSIARQAPNAVVNLTPPMLQTFRSNTGVILKDKETAQYVAGTDPVSGEVLKVGITLLVTK